jgi:hypothetical protein
MALKSTFIFADKKFLAGLIPGWLCFLASLLLFCTQNFVAFGENAKQDPLLKKDFSSLASARLVNYESGYLHMPFESAPKPDERETPNENEQEDDFDYDMSSVTEQETLFSIFDFSAIRNWVISYSSYFEGSSPVPFFVLYHSWKSYLS